MLLLTGRLCSVKKGGGGGAGERGGVAKSNSRTNHLDVLEGPSALERRERERGYGLMRSVGGGEGGERSDMQHGRD